MTTYKFPMLFEPHRVTKKLMNH